MPPALQVLCSRPHQIEPTTESTHQSQSRIPCSSFVLLPRSHRPSLYSAFLDSESRTLLSPPRRAMIRALFPRRLNLLLFARSRDLPVRSLSSAAHPLLVPPPQGASHPTYSSHPLLDHAEALTTFLSHGATKPSNSNRYPYPDSACARLYAVTSPVPDESRPYAVQADEILHLFSPSLRVPLLSPEITNHGARTHT